MEWADLVPKAAEQAGTEPSDASVEVQSGPATESVKVTEPVGSVRPVSVMDGVTTAEKLTG